MTPNRGSEPTPGRVPTSDAGAAAASAQPHAGATTTDPLAEKRLLVCVSGGIAAYKSAYLVRALVKAGARVIVAMTRNAQRFVTPLTFETLSGNPVVTSTFDRVQGMGAVEHIDVALWADLVIVAPATYNLLGKLNAGIADDAVTTLLSATRAPIFLAPSMNDHMWRNAVNQRNVEALRGLGYRFIDPERGPLACVWEGEGRLREPEAIVEFVRSAVVAGALQAAAPPDSGSGTALAGANPVSHGPSISLPRPRSPLSGRSILISAGGTREAIDPVRFIGNRSSGKMGYALASEAAARGARVLLVSGPTALHAPAGLVESVRVETADQMLTALERRIDGADILLMAAAVADYRPRHVAPQKMKRTADALHLELEPTPDLLQALAPRKGHKLFVGFALETEDPESSARAKLQRKGVDLVVANRVGADTGAETDTNQVWIYDAVGLVLQTPVLDKARIAAAILDLIESRLAKEAAGV